MEVKYANITEYDQHVLNVTEMEYAYIKKEKNIVKYVKDQNYVNQHGVKNMDIKNMKDIVYFVVSIYFLKNKL